MKRLDALKLSQHIAAQLKSALGTRFSAYWMFGSLLQSHYDPTSSNINGLLIVANDTPINVVRQAFWPLWESYGRALKRGPLVFTEESFARFLTFFPHTAAHLHEYGQQVNGRAVPLADPGPMDPDWLRAVKAGQLLTASALLAPELLDGGRLKESERILDRLCRQHQIDRSLPLNQQIACLSELFEQAMPVDLPEDQPPYGLKGLIAIYETLGDDFFIVENSAAIQSIDFSEAVQELSDREVYSLQVTTAEQFRLITRVLYPLDIALRSYQRIWGDDVLQGLEIPQEAVLSHAGRFSLVLEADQFPNTLFMVESSPEFDSKMIHDFQNKLLNIRLQNDLLHRLKISSAGEPPALPERTAPHPVRLQGIWEQFRWWSAYYERLLRTEPATEPAK